MKSLTDVRLELREAQDPISLCNSLVNENVAYAADEVLWQQADYWETPKEAFEKGADCEGIALTKMFLLSECGIRAERLLLLSGNCPVGAHMVLAIFPDLLILDNRTDFIVSLEKKTSFQPLWGISLSKLFYWFSKRKIAFMSTTIPIPEWFDVLHRYQNETYPLQIEDK